jgi:hypothetical protein
MLRIALALCTALLLSFPLPAGAQVVMDHLLGKYATTDDGCQSGATPEFEIRRGVIEGPKLHCILGAATDRYRTEAHEEMHAGTSAFGQGDFDLSARKTTQDQPAAAAGLDRALSLQIEGPPGPNCHRQKRALALGNPARSGFPPASHD